MPPAPWAPNVDLVSGGGLASVLNFRMTMDTFGLPPFSIWIPDTYFVKGTNGKICGKWDWGTWVSRCIFLPRFSHYPPHFPHFPPFLPISPNPPPSFPISPSFHLSHFSKAYSVTWGLQIRLPRSVTGVHSRLAPRVFAANVWAHLKTDMFSVCLCGLPERPVVVLLPRVPGCVQSGPHQCPSNTIRNAILHQDHSPLEPFCGAAGSLSAAGN